MSTQSDISGVIAEAWTAAPRADSGLARDITASNSMIRSMTDAIAAGILSALSPVPTGLPLKGWLYAESGRTITVSSGLSFELVSPLVGDLRTGWCIRAPASLGASVLVVWANNRTVSVRRINAYTTPGTREIYSKELESDSNGAFTGFTDTLALAF